MDSGWTIIELKTGQPQRWHLVQLAAYYFLVAQRKKEFNAGYKLKVKFQPKDHCYLLENYKLPSVASIIKEHLAGDFYPSIEAAARGSEIHRQTSIVDMTGPGEFTEKFSGSICPETLQYKKYIESAFPDFRRWIFFEIPLWGHIDCKKRNVLKDLSNCYAGTPDKLIRVPAGEEKAILLYLSPDSYEAKIIPVSELYAYFEHFQDAFRCEKFRRQR